MQLRRGPSIAWPRTQLAPNVRVPMEGVSGQCVDVELVLERQSALISGLILQSWTSTQGAAAVLYDWDSSQLEVRTCMHACMYTVICTAERCISSAVNESRFSAGQCDPWTCVCRRAASRCRTEMIVVVPRYPKSTPPTPNTYAQLLQ